MDTHDTRQAPRAQPARPLPKAKALALTALLWSSAALLLAAPPAAAEPASAGACLGPEDGVGTGGCGGGSCPVNVNGRCEGGVCLVNVGASCSKDGHCVANVGERSVLGMGAGCSDGFCIVNALDADCAGGVCYVNAVHADCWSNVCYVNAVDAVCGTQGGGDGCDAGLGGHCHDVLEVHVGLPWRPIQDDWLAEVQGRLVPDVNVP